MTTFTVTPGLPSDWDTFAGDGPAAGRARWIEFGQSWYPGEYHTFASRDASGACEAAIGGTVLASPAAVARRDPYSILTGRTSDLGLFANDDHPWPRDLDPGAVHPCLVLMYPNYATFPVGSHAGDAAGLRRFVSALVAWARAEGIAAIALVYLTPPADALVAELARAGFTTQPMGERCDMAVTWSDFDGYLGTLRKKYRDEVKRELNRMDDRHLIRSFRALNDDEPELLDLRCRLIEKYDGSVDRPGQAAIFDTIREYVAAQDITVFTVHAGERLLSFSLFIQDGHEWTVMLIGSAYGEPDAAYGYFSCMFYQPIEQAPARGVRRLAYGYGTLDAKRRRGCQLTRYHAAELRL